MQNDLCVLELLDILMAENNYFYPHHPNFKYKRITPKHVQANNYPVFVPTDVAVKFTKFTWHDTRLNLSLLCKIPGTIKVENNTYDTFIYRNFTIIKDGELNVNLLPCLIDSDLEELLITYYPDVIYENHNDITTLDLSKLPMINTRVCAMTTSAEKLSSLLLRKVQLECHMKVLKHYIKKSPVPVHNLNQYGIKEDGRFDPPQQMVKPTSYYTARAFNISIKGCNQFPAVSKASNSTIPGKFMREMIPLIHNDDIKDIYKETKFNLLTIKNDIQKYKFHMVLCDEWFDDLDNDDKYQFNQQVGTVMVNTVLTFSIDNVRVEYD
jgi:hypothetical protein